jgi:tetratricopeptide (TPR) repeat protein
MAGCARRVPVHTPEDRVIMHQVVAGETLESIAEDYYGDPGRSQELRRINALTGDDLEAGTIVQVVLGERDLAGFNTRKEARVPYNEGLELAARGSYIDAIPHFQDALEVDPRFVEARYNLGITYQKMKVYDKALLQFEEVIRLRPDNEAYHFAAGTCDFHLERYDKAARAFEKVLSLDPNHLKALFSLAAAYEKLGKTGQARETWQRYLRLDGTSEWAREARSRLEKLAR